MATWTRWGHMATRRTGTGHTAHVELKRCGMSCGFETHTGSIGSVAVVAQQQRSWEWWEQYYAPAS